MTDAVASPAAGLEAYERFPLLHGPSPVHRLARLTEHLGGPQIWAKREDVNTGVGMGGNKLRKLEYLVADALAQGCDTLVSIGGVQSNHTRSVAAAAAVAGLRARLVQESWVDWPDAVYDRVGNILLSRIMGAEVELVRSEFNIGVKESWQRAIDEVRDRGGRPYPIPAGASDHPLGGLGFAGFAFEVERQEAELGVFFDHVVVCTVTGSTQAGMIAGFAAGERPRRVLGIDASARLEETRDAVTRIARDTAARIGLGREPARRRDRGPRGLRGRALRRPGRADARGDPARRSPGGHGLRPGLRGQVDGRPGRPGGRRDDSRGRHGALRAPRRGAGAERVQRVVRLSPPALLAVRGAYSLIEGEGSERRSERGRCPWRVGAALARVSSC